MNTLVQVSVGDLVGVAFVGGCGLVALVGLFIAWLKADTRAFELKLRAESAERSAKFEKEFGDKRVGWAEERVAFWRGESDKWFNKYLAK